MFGSGKLLGLCRYRFLGLKLVVIDNIGIPTSQMFSLSYIVGKFHKGTAGFIKPFLFKVLFCKQKNK